MERRIWKTINIILTLLLIIGININAQTTIGFGDQGWAHPQDLNNFTITSNGQGFRFTCTSSDPGYEHRTSTSFCNYSDDLVIFTGGTVTLATFATTDGSDIDLISFDYINDFYCFPYTYTVTITGFKDGAAVSGANYSLANTGISTTMDVSGNSNFDAVDSIRITADNDMGGGGLDNIVWNTSPLPVELTFFTANIIDGDKIKLSWNTATELNNYGFEIQRQRSETNKQKSENGFETIGFVDGAGNSNSPKDYSFIDNSNEFNSDQETLLKYRLKQIDIDGKFDYSNIAEVNLIKVSKFNLEQNYPNPFNPATVIRYSLPSVAAPSLVEGLQNVTLKIYDILGNEVTTLVNENQPAGNYEVTFNASGLASGIYLYKLQTSNGFVSTKKLVLLR